MIMWDIVWRALHVTKITLAKVQKWQICFPTGRTKPCSEHFANCWQGIFKFKKNIFPFYKMFNDWEVSRIEKGGICLQKNMCVTHYLFLFKYIFYIFYYLSFINIIMESQRTYNFTVFWYLNVLVVQSNSGSQTTRYIQYKYRFSSVFSLWIISF